MTGPQHYQAAENLLHAADTNRSYDCELARVSLAEALVHATLALAAATALCQPTSEGPIAPCEWTAWNAAAGSEKP